MRDEDVAQDPVVTRSRSLQAVSHRLIPGGAHTYAKGDDRYPQNAPGFLARGRGSHVWDVDGNEYIEYSMGCRAVTLGHAHAGVLRAVHETLERGCNFTRPAEIEVACAHQLLELVAGAEMAKFTKDGSAATTAAVRLARAATGRPMVAVCEDHPFFAYHDWFIGTTPCSAGVPEEVQKLTATFRYNDLASLGGVLNRHAGRVAAVILEAAHHEEPQEDYLRKVQAMCAAHGVIFILDELLTGFRWHNGGAQAVYDVVPDLATFGKAMANGFAVSALVGKRELMELGGLQHDRERVYLLSTTHGGETHALAAALATMRLYAQEPVVATLYEKGRKLRTGLQQVIDRHHLTDYVQVRGRDCNLVYVTRDAAGNRSESFRSLLLQETIRRGILMPSLVVSCAHTDEDLNRTIEAVEAALCVYARALEDGVEEYLVGRPTKPIMRRYN